MHYDLVAIADSDIPRAADPLFQPLLDTYASETNKVITVWRGFAQEDLGFRPHPRSSTVADILKHQLLSERRFFGEFVSTPEPAAAEVLPKTQELSAYIRRMEELARPRLAFFAGQTADWWMQDDRSSVSPASGSGSSGGACCIPAITAPSSRCICDC